MKLASLLVGVVLISLVTGAASGASDEDISKLTTYAVILGRAMGCGIDVQAEASRVGAWMDRRFSNQEKATYLAIFAEGMKFNAEKQRQGKSPDSCAEVRSQYSSFPWP